MRRCEHTHLRACTPRDGLATEPAIGNCPDPVLFSLLVLAQLASDATAAPTPSVANGARTAPTFVPTRTAKAPTIDGLLDDAAWATAPSSTAFTQKFPAEGTAPSERTTLRVLYDDDAVYVAIDCDQTISPIVARMARRDREVESDSVSIDIDSRALGKTAFEFTVTAAGVLRDGIRSNDAVENGNRYTPAWDENWDARTHVRADGWSAELRIPLRILRFSMGAVQSWGFQARRYTSLRQETDEWSFVPRNVVSEVSLYGHLDGMRVRPHADLELKPFVLGRFVRSDPTDVTLDSGLTPGVSAGLDLRWHLTPDLTLDATANPDFTQVEGDELYLNLSNFESFFPEKRPFFVEGSEIFEAPAPLFFARPFQLLYTRRIGRRPEAPALRPDPARDKLVSFPSASTILGATKLVGRIDKSWSVGAITALTAENDVEVQDAQGGRHLQLADPTSLYQVVRVKHDFEGGKAHVGFLGTAVGHAEQTGRYPTYVPTPGAAPRQLCTRGAEVPVGARCTHDAYVGGVDGLWRSEDGDIFISGQAISSVISNGPPRVLRDGTMLSGGDAGYGAQVIANREGGEGLAWNAQYQFASRKLDFNDVGYMERQNQHFYYGALEYRSFKPLGPTVESHAFFETTSRHNLDGVKLNRRWLADVFVKYASFWNSYFEVHLEEARYDDREIGNGQPFERPSRPGITAQFSSDKRKSVYVEGSLNADVLPHGSMSDGHISALLRVHPQLEIELTPSASHTTGETRFAARGAPLGELVFGSLSASSFATTARINLTLTPRLSLQTFGQLFLASGHYDDFRAWGLGGHTGSIEERVNLSALVATSAPAESPDFLDVSLNINAVVRWEYSLGSVVYLVFNRSQTPASSVTLTEPAALSFVPLGRAPAVDTLLLKWQLFLNL